METVTAFPASNHISLKAFSLRTNKEVHMRVIFATVLGLTLLGAVAPALAQPYGGRDYGYDRGDYDRRDRDYDSRDRRDYGRDYDRAPRGGRGDYAFDEMEYLRCNPDVRRAVISGQVKSGLYHYRKVGMAEGRRLSC